MRMYTLCHTPYSKKQSESFHIFTQFIYPSTAGQFITSRSIPFHPPLSPEKVDI